MSSSDSSEKKQKRKIFEDCDAEEDYNKLTENFDNALKKKQFLGEKGKYLFYLQNTYSSDSRFKLDNKFKGDIDLKKLSSKIKKSNNNNKDEYDYKDNNILAEDENIQEEKNKNLFILSNILPNSAFLDHKKKESNIKNIIQKRFDPLLNLGDFSVEPLKVEDKKKKKENDNKIILEKGVQVFGDSLENPIYKNKNKKMLKKREREKLIEKEVNRINNDMNQEIIINYDMWKKSIQSKENVEFKLFEDNNIKKENNKNEKENIHTIHVNIEKDKNDKEKKDKLENKRKREKQKRKLRIEKEKIKKEEKRKNEEKMNDKYKSHLIENFGEDKANNYFKYMDMIKEKKLKTKNKK